MKSVSHSMFLNPVGLELKSLQPSLIFAIVRVVTATILECQLACLYPFNKSDFLSEIRALLFEKE